MAVKIYAVHDKSGYAGSGTGAANWDSLHDTNQAKNAFFAQEDGTQGVRVQGNASTVNLFRAFFEFNVPEDAPSSIQSLTLNIKGKGSNNDLDVIVIEGTQDASSGDDGDGSAYGATVMNAFTGWGSGWDDSDVTEYSSEVTSWSNSDYNTITLNATARAAFTPNATFKVVLMSHDYDYLDVNPTSSTIDQSIDFHLQGSGTSQDVYIEYEASDPRDITGPLKIQAGAKFKISAGKLTIKT